MHLPPLIALFAWIPLGVFLFYRFPVRNAILANFLGGWALLPSANFVPSAVDFPYWIMGVCLPSEYIVTKATVLGLTALLGTLLFDARSILRFRSATCDLPIVIWCTVPLLSSIANRASVAHGVGSVVYAALAWGVPYLLGRIYFVDRTSLLLAARAFILAGLLYIPICLIESLAGPQFYAHIYGFQPYRWIGADRFVGYRPVGFLEDGNQLGIWMAGSALVATAVAVLYPEGRMFCWRMPWIAAALVVTAVLCQSWGSILLLAALLPFVLWGRKSVSRRLIAVVILGMVAFAGLRLANVVSLRSLVERSSIARSVAGDLKGMGRGSLGWRLEEDEIHARLAVRKPVLGYGRWNWWEQGGEVRPWGLWLLAFGMYGAVGLFALGSLLLSPVVKAVSFAPPVASMEFFRLRMAFAGLILLVAVDSLLNGAVILPVLILVGAMSATLTVRRVTASK